MSKSIGVDGVGLLLAQIPGDAGTAQHRAGQAPAAAPFGRDDADVDGALLPDAVVGQQGFVFVDAPGSRSVKSSMKSSIEPWRHSLKRFQLFLTCATAIRWYFGIASGRSRYTPPGR
jgi:hypothetical protein